MKKYLQCFRMGMQKALTYRAVEFIWVVSAFIAPILYIAVWSRSDQSLSSGYTVSEMITYYIVIAILSQLITPHIDWDVANTIKKGELNFFLLKPYRFIIKLFLEEIPWKMLNAVLTTIPIGILAILYHRYISFPHLNIGIVLSVLFMSLTSYILLFLVQFCFGCLAFWLTEVFGMMRIFYVFNSIFGGRAFPLTLMPNFLQSAGKILPFQYFWYIPTLLLIGKASIEEMEGNFYLMFLWIVILLILATFLWKKGLRSYSAYGG